MAKSVTSELPILIVGGGPSGLGLAQGLRKRGIPYRVFERDVDDAARGQGWAVALQWVLSGLQHNLPDDLPPIETISHLYNLGLPCEIAVFDGISGEEEQRHSQGSNFLRADRLKLRDWLKTNIKVEWNKRFDYYTADGFVKAHFEDGTEAQGCLLVGADGYNSKVEGSKLNVLPMDTIVGNLVLPKEEYDEIFRQLARSICVVRTPQVYLFIGLHNISDDGELANWYWIVFHHHVRDGYNPELENWASERIYKQALEWLQPVQAKFKEIVFKTKPEDCRVMSRFMDTWSPPEAGFSTDMVTLLGDAAHKMTPFHGQGVNNALQDTIDLCELLESCDSITEVVKKYDEKVVKRGRKAVEETTRWTMEW